MVSLTYVKRNKNASRKRHTSSYTFLVLYKRKKYQNVRPVALILTVQFNIISKLLMERINYFS